MSDANAWMAVAGLTVITVVARSLFFISRRPLPMPAWLQEGLRHAPLAALAAIVVPSVLMGSSGQWIQTWQDPQLFGALAGLASHVWRRNILTTIACGTGVMLVLRLGMGW